MAKHLPVPKELEHLVEKRDHEQDRRRNAERRKAAERRQKRRRKNDR